MAYKHRHTLISLPPSLEFSFLGDMAFLTAASCDLRCVFAHVYLCLCNHTVAVKL